FAVALISNGFAGLLFQSYAKGASATDLNIVLWKWTGDSCALDVVDDEGRLSRL
ncbi:MAG: RES domain-containing protein, partial [Sulfitobacter sp. SK025]